MLQVRNRYCCIVVVIVVVVVGSRYPYNMNVNTLFDCCCYVVVIVVAVRSGK